MQKRPLKLLLTLMAVSLFCSLQAQDLGRAGHMGAHGLAQRAEMVRFAMGLDGFGVLVALDEDIGPRLFALAQLIQQAAGLVGVHGGGQLAGGGSVSVSGTIGLSGALPANLSIRLSNATYSDRETIRTTLSGDLAVADLPGAWNDGMADLLGVTPPNDTLGCLFPNSGDS